MTTADQSARVAPSIEVQHAVLMALVEHPTVGAAAPGLLQAVCAAMDFEVGALWLVDVAGGVLRCAGTWARRPDAVAAFVAATTQRSFAPDEGLPGHVWSRAEPLSLQDVTAHGNFPRRAAAEACDLHAAFAFPVLGAGRVLGVIEGFGHDTGEPDANLRRAVQSVGREVGLALLREATERERARIAELLAAGESRLQAILDAALDCVITIDPEGRVIDFNAAAERTFGIPRDAIVRQPLAEHIIPARFRDAHHRGLRHYLATGEGPVLHRRIELSALRHDGTEFPVELAITPVRLADGTQIFTAFLRDITERKHAEEQLQAARVAAERSVAAKEQFLANISHELRTPLNAVVGLAHLLESASMDGEQRGHLDGLRFAADALLDVINDLLDFARMRSGRISFAREPFELRPVLEGLVGFVTASARARGLTVSLEVDGTVPATVVGDASRLNQVLLNLVANAIKFTHQGSVTLSVGTVPGDGAALLLRFSVSDTGIGIDPEDQQTIFEAFQQARSERLRPSGGSGLGLAIVKEIVQQQGGTVSLESAVGLGTIFHVTLPFAAVDERPPILPEPGLVPGLAGRRVLLVEDNELNQRVATRILERAGAVVVTAGTGREGVERARAESFDVVLMDLQMPEMDGYEAAWRIRHDLGLPPERLPIMALSATVLTDEQRRGQASGMTDFILKPFRPDFLCQRVAAILEATGAVARPGVGGHIDVRSLEEQALGQAEFMGELIEIFLRAVPPQIDALESAADRGDTMAIRQLAHRLKSQAGTVGALGLQRALEALESLAGAPGPTAHPPVSEARSASRLAREVVTELRALRQHHGEAAP